MTDAVEIQAATVVPLRDGVDGLEVLMLRRNSKLAYGGMWVFPGGRVDAADGDPSTDGEDVVARRAAVREAMEEAAIALETDTLVAFSHWTPPVQAPRRFLTWFFLAPVVDGAEVVIDGGEIHEHVWVSPTKALEQRDAAEVELAPPTWMTLWRLRQAADVGTALAEAEAREPQRFHTHVASHEGVGVMLWRGDAGWEAGDPSLPGPRYRLTVDPDGWRYEGPP